MSIENKQHLTKYALNVTQIAMGGGALATALLAANVADDIGDVVKAKYIAQASPIWETAGKSELMSNYGNLYRGTRAKEMLYNMMFNAPEAMSTEAGKSFGKEFASAATSPGAPDVASLVSSLSRSPEVKAVGRKRAKDLVDEVISLAPRLTSAAPSMTLPILQTAIDSGSMSLRPEMVKTLIDAESKYVKK